MSEEKSVGGGLRKVLLFLILGLLLVALGYDYTVARPAVDDAYNRIAERSVEVNADSTAKFTNGDVKQLLGKEPAETFDDANGDRVEVYTWASGLPLKSHRLFTVYKMNNGEYLFHRQVKGKFETSTDVSIYDGTQPLVVDYSGASEDDADDADYAESPGNARRPDEPDTEPDAEGQLDDDDLDGDGTEG